MSLGCSTSDIPGFNADIAYTKHANRVKAVQPGPSKSFISFDQSSLHIWTRNHMSPDVIDVSCCMSFPSGKSHFIAAVCHASPLAPSPIVLAACLDNTLKVYTDKLKLRSCIPWTCGSVTHMLYNHSNDTIITNGSAGVQLWCSRPDTEALANTAQLSTLERPWLDALGRNVPWCFGRFERAHNLFSFHVPGLKAHITAADVAVLDAGSADVYGFDAVTGTRLYAWQHLSQHALTSIVWTKQQQLITASREATATVWQLQQNSQLAKLTSLGRFPAGVHCLAAAPAHPWLLTASLDGLVVAWSTESWQQMYRMKLSESVAGLQFYAADKFLCTSGSAVRLFKLKQEAEVWMEFSSPLTSLEPLQSGLLLATFADSSVRLLDCRSGATDKTAVTVVPQLSSAGLLQAAVSQSRGRLYALLTNGHIHVWELRVTRPPAFLEAWTLLEDEKCCSLAYMEGQGVAVATGKHLGLSTLPLVSSTVAATSVAASSKSKAAVATAACSSSNSSTSDGSQEYVVEDHVWVGTGRGEVLACDVSRGGLLVLRVPVLKLLPVTLLKVDTNINRLVAGGSNVVTVWDLTTLTCMAEFGANEQFTSLCSISGCLMLGGSNGRCFVLDLTTGQRIQPGKATCSTSRNKEIAVAAASATPATDATHHEDAVLAVSGSAALQHFVSCSRDGYVKVFDRSCRVKAVVFMAAPLAVVSFMNDDGDLLVAAEAATRLLLIRASRYAVTDRHPGAVSTMFHLARHSASSAMEAVGSSGNSSAGGSAVQPHRKPRPPLDLDDSRAKADLARALHPPLSGRLGLARCNTISRMVQTAARQQACSCACGGCVWDWALGPVRTESCAEGYVGLRHGCSDNRSPAVVTAAVAAAGCNTGGVHAALAAAASQAKGAGWKNSNLKMQQHSGAIFPLGSSTAPGPSAARQLLALSRQPAPSLNISGRVDHQQKLLLLPPQQRQQQATLQDSGCDSTSLSTMQTRSTNAAAEQGTARAIPGCVADAVCALQMQTRHQQQGIRHSVPAGSVWNTVHGYNLAAVPGVLQDGRWRRWHGNDAALPGGSAVEKGNGSEVSSSSCDGGSSSSCDGGSSSSCDGGSSSSGIDQPDACAHAAAGGPHAAAAPSGAAAAANNNAVCRCNEELSLGVDGGQHADIPQAPTRMPVSLITSIHQSNKTEQHWQGSGKPCPTIEATASTAVIAAAADDDHDADDDNSGNHCAVTLDAVYDDRSSTGCPCSSISSIQTRLLGLQPLMRRAVAVVQHPTVFMEGSVSPAELQGLLRKSTTHHAIASSKRKDKCSKSKKKKSIASAACAAMRETRQAVGEQAALAAPAIRWTGAVPGSPQIKMLKNRKKNKKKQQQKLLSSLPNTAAHPLRGCGISSVAKHQQHKTGQPGPLYTSVLELLKHTTRDTAVLTELKTAEAHDMRQAAAMRTWMSVGSAVTGSTVVAAALRAAEVAASTLAAAAAPAFDKM